MFTVTEEAHPQRNKKASIEYSTSDNGVILHHHEIVEQNLGPHVRIDHKRLPVDAGRIVGNDLVNHTCLPEVS
jgi:hypothetical protein